MAKSFKQFVHSTTKNFANLEDLVKKNPNVIIHLSEEFQGYIHVDQRGTVALLKELNEILDEVFVGGGTSEIIADIASFCKREMSSSTDKEFADTMKEILEAARKPPMKQSDIKRLLEKSQKLEDDEDDEDAYWEIQRTYMKLLDKSGVEFG